MFGSYSLVEEFTLIEATWHCLVDHVSRYTKQTQHGTVPTDW